MDRLSGKTALITGGARGIGLSIAERFRDEGASVALCDVNEEGVKAAAEGLGDDSRGYVMNVVDPESVAGAVRKVLADFGGIDILLNNAGITRDTLMLRMKKEDWDAVISVNLTGTFNVSQAVIRPMMKTRSGRIINMSSVVGVMGNPGQANYAASKAGVIGLTKSMAKEVAPRGITVNAIAPGYIETEMTAHLSDEAKEVFLSSTPLNRPGSVADVASAAVFLASDDASFITGQVLNVNGGMVM